MMMQPSTIAEKKEDDQQRKGWAGLGVVYVLLSTGAFSLASTLLKRSAAKWHPFTVGVVTFPVATLFFVPFLVHGIASPTSLMVGLTPWRKNKTAIFFVAIRTFASSIIPFVVIWSLQYISVGDMRTILAASVITVHFAGWLCLGEGCGVVPTLAAIMAMIGIGVMTRPPILTGKDDFDQETVIGVAIASFAMIMITVVIVVVRWLQIVHHAMLNFTLYVWASVESIVLAVVFNTLEEFTTNQTSWEDIGIMSTIGVAWAVGNLFLVLGLQVEEAGIVGLIKTSEVVFTFGWQWILIGLPPDWISLLGALLVVSGVIAVIARKLVQSLPETSPKRKAFNFLLA
ncbi:solute carrier family 35 member G1 [Folsomia candida]|uniref:solute carrier family 35 member G1 n=1 Tax=Folsomia candida TaxID=158441 RepID=UPI000B8F9E36|nr:solute carrier family 35 member G1 [Folsomia candida]